MNLLLFLSIKPCKESIESADEKMIGTCTVVKAIHKLLSIAVGSTLTPTKCFVRKNSNPESAHNLIEDFMNELESIAVAFENSLPEYFQSALSRLESDIAEIELHNAKKSKLTFLRSKLEKYTKLNVFGFNSSRYDLNCIIPFLIKCLKEREMKVNSVSVIKKGCAYFLLSNEDWIMKVLSL